jgi:hypothetical protein
VNPYLRWARSVRHCAYVYVKPPPPKPTIWEWMAQRAWEQISTIASVETGDQHKKG